MVVDGLLHTLALLERLDVLVHEVKVLRGGVQRSDALLLAAKAVKGVVVIEADDGRHLGDEGVGIGVAAGRGLGVRAEHGRHAAHEGGLSAS